MDLNDLLETAKAWIVRIYADNGLWPTLITLLVVVIVLVLLANLGVWTQ